MSNTTRSSRSEWPFSQWKTPIFDQFTALFRQSWMSKVCIIHCLYTVLCILSASVFTQQITVSKNRKHFQSSGMNANWVEWVPLIDLAVSIKAYIHIDQCKYKPKWILLSCVCTAKNDNLHFWQNVNNVTIVVCLLDFWHLTGSYMNSMKLVIPLHLISWKKTPIDAVTPQCLSQFTPKIKAKRFCICFHLWCELTSTTNVTEWQVSWNSCQQLSAFILNSFWNGIRP